MTAPVALFGMPAPSRSASGTGSTGSDGGAFASALDGALSGTSDAGRPPADRGVRRDAHDRSEDRRGDHAAARSQRSEHGRGHVGGRRGADRSRPERAAEDADETPSDDTAPADPTAPTAQPATAWALLAQGAALTAATPTTVPATPVPATTAVGALGEVGPATTVVAVTADPGALSLPTTTAPTVDTAPLPAPATPGSEPAPTPAAPASAAVVTATGSVAAAPAPDGFTVVQATVQATAQAAAATSAAPATAAALEVPAGQDAVPPTADVPTTTAVPTSASAGGDTAGSTGDGSDRAPADGSEAPVAAPVTATPPAAAPAPVTATAPAAPSAPATAQPPVAAQLSQPVAVLASRPDGVHTMTVVLTPDDLGPVQVQVTVSGGSLDLDLAGSHEHGRAALLEALPDLRRDLLSAGLTLSRLDVSRDTSGSFAAQQQAPGQQWGHGSQQRGDARPAPWLRTADAGEGRPARTATSSSTSTGVDVRV